MDDPAHPDSRQSPTVKADAPRPLGARARSMSSFWIFFWLAAAAVGAKAYYLGWPARTSEKTPTDWFADLSIIVAADLRFALVAGIASQFALSIANLRPALGRAMWWFMWLLGAIGTAYAAANLPIYRILRSPLTYGMIDLLGGPVAAAGAARRLIGSGLAIAMASAAAGYLLLAWLSDRYLQPRRTKVIRTAQVAGAVLLVCYLIQARRVIAESWAAKHDDRRFADSPHELLLTSWASHLLGRGFPVGTGAFAAGDLDDFHGLPAGTPPTVMPRRPKNVIFIVLESVETRYLSVYGSRYPTTPRLAAEAKHALIFDNFYSLVTNSGNALVSMTLSRYPPMSWRPYTEDHPDMPGVAISDLMHQAGYRTAFISSIDFSYASCLAFIEHRSFDTRLNYLDLGGEKISYWGVDDRYLIDGILHQLDENRDGSGFVMCWNQQTHHPFDLAPGQPQIDFFGNDKPTDDWDLGHYLNALHHVDEQLGRLFDGLRQRKLDQDTLVVIIGDHGEAFGSPHPNYGHSGKVYQEDVNVPLILWCPGLFKGERSQALGALVDLPPTLADIAGIAPSPAWQGRSLLSAAPPRRVYFFGSKDTYLLGLREGKWKYICNTTDETEELYDLRLDPDEQHNLATEHPDLCHRFRQRLSAWVYSQIHSGRY